MRSRYEQLIEYIINDETEKAKELFHSLVVEKSRDIYNDLVAEETEEEVTENFGEMGEAGSMDQTDDMMHDIEADHEGMDMDHDDDSMEMGDDEGMGDEGHEEEEIEDRVMDLEDALDELKTEFEKLMADEAGEPEHQDMDMGHAEESAPQGMVREYVEKVASPGNTEGTTVGAQSSSKPTVNAKSIVAGKNDMGGSTKNIARGGSNESPDDKQYRDPSNEYSKGKGNLPHAGKFENVPGGDAGKAFSNAKKPVTKEPGGVNKKDILP